jgi:hypothetical protein
MLPPFSGSNGKPGKKPAYCLIHDGFFLGPFFDLEDGDDMLLSNIS